MDANSWVWIAVIALLALCFIPMLFMGKGGDRRDAAENQSRKSETTDRGAR